MKKYFTTLFLLIAFPSIFAQELTMDLLQKYTPRNIGPGGMSGRVTAIDVVHNQKNTIYVGTASGGIWKSTSGGINWTPIFEKEVTASIGAIAIQQSNPSVIWAGTGEGNPRNSLNGGYGIYKSLDGGKNWKSLGLEKTRHIHRIIIDPKNPNIVYVAAIGSPWGKHPERGIFKTTDGGKTWKKILFANNLTGAAELVMDPSNPNKLIAALWEHKRDPWFFKSGGKGSGLFITHDGGATWEQKTEKHGLPKGELGRIGIAIAKNKPSVVYALIESSKNALYKSEDGGFNWKKINDKTHIGNRPFYYSDITVDPNNENRVYSIFTYVNVSEDGGKSFKQLMPAYGVSNGVHPDHHAWWIHPEDGNFMIDGNDGGLNITRDGGKNWRFIGNLPLAQFYHINYDNEIPYNVYGGMQDNGSWKGPAYVWKTQGIRNSYWQEILFGDGFDVIPDKDDARFGWSMSQQGYVFRYDSETGNNYIVRPTHPDPNTKLRFNWNSAINIDPVDNNTIYFGSQFVHKSNNKGLTWQIISPDLTTNDPEKQKQSESGGLTMDATGAENYCSILVIEPSPLEKNMLWVGTDDGKVHISKDGGTNWTDVSKNLKELPTGSWITQIKASNKNKGEALLVANDYRRFNYSPYAFRTKDYGNTWKRIVTDKDVQSYALSIIEDPKEKNLLFLGTDDGLYISLDAGNKWTKWTAGFPTVSVKDLAIHPREHDLIIGTFGRAAWVLDNIKPLRAIAKNKDILANKIHAFAPQTAYLAAYHEPTGSRFGGDALFNGENRKKGVSLPYFIQVQKKKEETKKKEDEENDELEKTKIKWDSITIKIYNEDQLIRSLKHKTPDSTGVHKIQWLLREKGAKRLTEKPQKNDKEPSGVTVKPGTYRVQFVYGDQTSETSVEVLSDPRLQTSSQSITERYDTSKEIDKLTAIASDAYQQLYKSKETTLEYQKKLKKLDKEKYKDQIDLCKKTIKQIDSIATLFVGKEDKRQGIIYRSPNNVMDRLNIANYYISTRQNGITTTEKTLIKHLTDALQQALDKTNSFFDESWKKYKDSIEKLELSPFKKVKQFTID